MGDESVALVTRVTNEMPAVKPNVPQPPQSPMRPNHKIASAQANRTAPTMRPA